MNFQFYLLILNYFKLASKKIEDLSEIEFLSDKNESLKNMIISSLSEGDNFEAVNEKIKNGL